MNIHHLELFYYVAKHGGISEAVRNIPYGIQQPSVSSQIIQLEEHLGTTLFQRRPFALTPPGKELYEFIEPFFGRLDNMTTRLQGGVTHQVRIGASADILRDHLPDLMSNIRKHFPKVRLSLRSANQPELVSMIEQGEIDMAITLIGETTPQGLRTQALLKLPLILLIPASSPITSADELWTRDRIDEPLIALPPNEIVCRQFQATLSKKGIDWFPSLEVNSLNLIDTYTENGYGIGLTVRMPLMQLPAGLRTLDLPGFPPVSVGMLWRGKPTGLIQAILDEAKKRAKALAASGGGALP